MKTLLKLTRQAQYEVENLLRNEETDSKTLTETQFRDLVQNAPSLNSQAVLFTVSATDLRDETLTLKFRELFESVESLIRGLGADEQCAIDLAELQELLKNSPVINK